MRPAASRTGTCTAWGSTSRRSTSSARRSPTCPPTPGASLPAVQTAVVTGAGRGIGREIARRLAKRGFAVLVTDVNEATAQETADEIGGGAWAMAQDVRDADSHRAVAKAASERGPLKVWVNNAGVMSNRNAWDHDDAEVKLHVDVNFFGVLWGARAAVDTMRADPNDAH